MQLPNFAGKRLLLAGWLSQTVTTVTTTQQLLKYHLSTSKVEQTTRQERLTTHVADVGEGERGGEKEEGLTSKNRKTLIAHLN